MGRVIPTLAPSLVLIAKHSARLPHTMESKLKALKVVDLKAILTEASVTTPAKANKNDLIARIIASPAALAVYNKHHPTPGSTPASSSTTAKTSTAQTDDLLAPPEDVDWNEDDADGSANPSVSPVPVSKPISTKHVSPAKPKATKPSAPPAPPLKTSAAPPAPAVAPAIPTSAQEDAELEARKKRAARFGVPLVEPTKPRVAKPPRGATRNGNPAAVTAAAPNSRPPVTSVDDPEKLLARAARFGNVAVAGQKRSAPAFEDVDAEEQEKRRKRAERFGTKPIGTKA